MTTTDRGGQGFPDTLLGIVHDIWEGRGAAAATAEHMHPDVILRSPLGLTQGEGAATAAVLSTLAGFPDRQVLGEDVIWSGSPQLGFLGAQRSVVLATHSGDGPLGPPSGQRLRHLMLSETYAKANRICEVWEVTDTAAVLAQTGTGVQDWARARLAATEGRAAVFTPAEDVPGPYTGRGNDNRWGQAFADLVERIMAGELRVIAEQYDRACQLAYPGGEEAHGHAGADRFWLGLRAAFPSARFEIHHQIGREDPMLPPRAALRWSLTGRHDGWGAFGRPSGAQVWIMGLSQAEFGPGGLRREWTLYDAAAIWTQILRATG
jgi:predicted ester cyclase